MTTRLNLLRIIQPNPNTLVMRDGQIELDHRLDHLRLRVLQRVEPLQQADEYVARFCEGVLFWKQPQQSVRNIHVS